MGTTFTGTPNHIFSNTFTDFLFLLDANGQPDLSEGFDPRTTHLPTDIGTEAEYVMTFADNAVSYALSPSAVNIDLGDNTASLPGNFAIAALQHGGSAEGDVLVD